MQIARVRLFSLFGAMLFLLNLLTSNVIYHNICILSTLILKNLMYLKSIDELHTPFPLSAFITFHSLSLPSVAFHYLLSPLLFHTSVFHAPLSALLCFASLFYSLCFTPSIVFTLSHCFTSFVLFLPPLLYSLPLFYTALLYSLPLFTPPSLYLLPLFCTRFFTPRQPPQTRPRHRKRQRFSHFSKKFCKKPLTKQKKVLY